MKLNKFGHGLQRFIERGRFHPSGWSVLRLLLVIGLILFGLNFVLRSSGVEAYYTDLVEQYDEERAWNDLSVLTSPQMNGRAAGTDGGTLAAGYISNQFEAAGLVDRHNFEGGPSVYELSQGAHHDHVVCVQCGKVEEFVDDTIEERQAIIAAKSGFKMTDHSLNIYGICPNCQNKE